jgi:hypothetical protein
MISTIDSAEPTWPTLARFEPVRIAVRICVARACRRRLSHAPRDILSRAGALLTTHRAVASLDNCCHVNTNGQRIVVQAMGKVMRAELGK